MAFILSSGVLGDEKVFIKCRRGEVRWLCAPMLKENNPVCNIDKYTNENS